MLSPAPAFSFYVKDFLLGTVTMTLAARGAYITLLAYQWDCGSVPSDPAARQRILGCTKREADALWLDVRVKFQLGQDGLWRNTRLEFERSKQADRRAALASNGSKGGRPPKNQTESNRLSESQKTDNQNESLAFSSASALSESTHTPRVRMSPLIPAGAHKRHAVCGVVCLPAALWESFLAKLGGNDERLTTWTDEILTDWQGRVDRGEAIPDGDDFDFWRNRWAESFGSTKPAAARPEDASRAVPGTEQTGQYLTALRGGRAS